MINVQQEKKQQFSDNYIKLIVFVVVCTMIINRFNRLNNKLYYYFFPITFVLDFLGFLMQTISFDFKFSLSKQNLIPQSKIETSIAELAALSFLDDIHRHSNFHVLEQIRNYKNSLIILVGIGGSSLGALAIIRALALHQDREFYCADTIDSDHSTMILEKICHAFSIERPVILIIISKSGTTLETLANGQLFLSTLQKYRPSNWQEHCLVISDKNSPLWNFGTTYACPTFEIPQNIGGRFSVFTAVGLIPCYLMGIDIAALLRGANDIWSVCQQPHEDNPAALTASALYNNYCDGFIIHDTFIFSTALAHYGAWYRQLLAESIGKKNDLYGNKVSIGITPTISNGTNDLHSVGQLTLAGPKNKYTTFITVERNQRTIEIPQGILAPQLVNISFTALMQGCAQGTIEVYEQEKLPFNAIALSTVSAYTLGALMHYTMLSVVLLGNFFDINTFDQPEVEKYKIRTRKALNL